MWIKTQAGKYVNADTGVVFQVFNNRKMNTYDVVQNATKEQRTLIAIFSNEEDAQKYLDRMMKAMGGRIFEVDMRDWNYTGHRKDHKEIRHGGS